MKKRHNFSSFTLAEAFKGLGLIRLNKWPLSAPAVTPSSFYHERLRRLKAHFDLRGSGQAKELLIDAVCEEALQTHSALRIWKGIVLESGQLSGTLAYVLAPRQGELTEPLLCIVVAERDDFERGLVECLVAMKACQQYGANTESGRDVYGIVSNGEGWKFYKLARNGQVFESVLFVIGTEAQLFGCLHYVLAECEKNIAKPAFSGSPFVA